MKVKGCKKKNSRKSFVRSWTMSFQISIIFSSGTSRAFGVIEPSQRNGLPIETKVRRHPHHTEGGNDSYPTTWNHWSFLTLLYVVKKSQFCINLRKKVALWYLNLYIRICNHIRLQSITFIVNANTVSHVCLSHITQKGYFLLCIYGIRTYLLRQEKSRSDTQGISSFKNQVWIS